MINRPNYVDKIMAYVNTPFCRNLSHRYDGGSDVIIRQNMLNTIKVNIIKCRIYSQMMVESKTFRIIFDIIGKPSFDVGNGGG